MNKNIIRTLNAMLLDDAIGVSSKVDIWVYNGDGDPEENSLNYTYTQNLTFADLYNSIKGVSDE